MRRFRGSLSKVLVSDDVLGAEEPTWREVHPGVTVRRVDDEAVVIWARPYPGHPGGFVGQDHIRQDFDQYARALSDLFDLFDSEAIACHEFDLPHVEAFPYLVRVVDLATRVLVQRLPGELEDYLEHPDDDSHPRPKPSRPASIPNPPSTEAGVALFRKNMQSRPNTRMSVAEKARLSLSKESPKPSNPSLRNGLPKQVLPREEALALFDKNQRNRPITRVGVAEKARLSLSGKVPRSSEPKPEG